MKKVLISTILLVILIPILCFGVRDPLRDGASQNLDEVIEKILSWLFPIALVVAVLMILIGAFMLVTGGASPDMVNKGKKTIIYALIGLSIVIISKGILELVRVILGIN